MNEFIGYYMFDMSVIICIICMHITCIDVLNDTLCTYSDGHIEGDVCRSTAGAAG